MNRLLGKDRAIVSPTAGTTRDLVEDDLMLNGIRCRVIDTAGIRETNESIEGEGVRRSRQAMERADVVLILLDASRPDDPETLPPLKEPRKEKSILVWNKIDLVAARPLLCHGYPSVVEASAETGAGMDALAQAIDRLIWSAGTPRRDEVLITSLRHKEALERAGEALYRVADGLKTSLFPEFIAAEMRGALLSLGTILGTDVTEDVLNAIFSKFCIGK